VLSVRPGRTLVRGNRPRFQHLAKGPCIELRVESSRPEQERVHQTIMWLWGSSRCLQISTSSGRCTAIYQSSSSPCISDSLYCRELGSDDWTLPMKPSAASWVVATYFLGVAALESIIHGDKEPAQVIGPARRFDDERSRGGPTFKPPGGSTSGYGSDFVCDYSAMTGWRGCSTPDDRSCWLTSDKGEEFRSTGCMFSLRGRYGTTTAFLSRTRYLTSVGNS